MVYNVVIKFCMFLSSFISIFFGFPVFLIVRLSFIHFPFGIVAYFAALVILFCTNVAIVRLIWVYTQRSDRMSVATRGKYADWIA